jgi:hypothetical protein
MKAELKNLLVKSLISTDPQIESSSLRAVANLSANPELLPQFNALRLDNLLG